MRRALQWRNPYFWLVVLGSLAMAAGIFIRFYRLTFPNAQVFDEVYFPVFAQHYIDRTSFYDVHPPFGKYVIAIGMLLFGDNTFGWRIMPALFGLLIIALMASLYWQAFKDKVGAWLIAIFMAVDGIFIVYSRTGLMDGILFFFIFACLLASLNLKGRYRVWWLTTLIGISFAIKWPALAIVLPALIYAHRQEKGQEFVGGFWWILVVYYFIVLTGQLLIRASQPWLAAFNWNADALHYHATITATHPWGSAWWGWPIPIRPVLFWYESVANGQTQVITSLGNPLLWLASSAAVLGTVIYLLYGRIRKQFSIVQHDLFPLVVGYFALWLPWAPVKRVLFLYHYVPAYGFALLILTYWLSKLWKSRPWLVLAIVLVVIAVSVYYLPFNIGWWSLSQPQIHQRLLLKSWL